MKSFKLQGCVLFGFLNRSPKIELNTLKGFDSSELGIYFITVCEWVCLFFPGNVLMSLKMLSQSRLRNDFQ